MKRVLWRGAESVLLLSVIAGFLSCVSADKKTALAVPVPDTVRLLDVLCDCRILQEEIFVPDRFQPVSETGAAGANLKYERGERDRWYIEEQRIAGDRIEAGIVHRMLDGDDKGLIDRAVRELDWAFSRQGEDGGFPGCADPFHSTEIFAGSVARGLLLIRQSELPEYQYIVDRYLGRLHKTGYWLVDSDIAREGKKTNQPYTHRKHIISEALGTIAWLTGDEYLSDAALAYSREGLDLMTPDGLSPELGGLDASYMDAGAMMAMRYRLVCPDRETRDRIAYMAGRTLDYVSGRVDSEGNVDTRGDTRVGGTHVHRDGSPKRFNYSEGITAFCLGYYTIGKPAYLDVARNIAKSGVHRVYMK